MSSRSFNLGSQWSEERIKKQIAVFDDDGDGKLNPVEWKRAFALLGSLPERVGGLLNGFITSFVALLDEGGLAGVEKLVLSRNAISEQGMQELAAAVTRGGLPSCTILYLDNNPGSGKRGYRKVGEALKQRKK